MPKKHHDHSPIGDLNEAYQAAVDFFGKDAVEQYETVRDARLRSAFAAKFGAPDRPVAGAGQVVGPYEYWGRRLFWRFDEGAEKWHAVELADYRDRNYMHRRSQICTLAGEHRDRMQQDELLAFLIQACIVTGLNRRPTILEAVEFATMFEEEAIVRVLERHRGKSAAKPMWWVDRQKIYHLFDD